MLTLAVFHHMMMKFHHKCLICFRLLVKENLVNLNYITVMDVTTLSHNPHSSIQLESTFIYAKTTLWDYGVVIYHRYETSLLFKRYLFSHLLFLIIVVWLLIGLMQRKRTSLYHHFIGRMLINFSQR